MANPSPHRAHEHGEDVPQSAPYSHDSHSTHQHGPATSSDATAHAHHAHGAAGADHARKRPRQARRPLRRDVPPEVLGHAPALDPDADLGADDPALVRLHGAGRRRLALDPRDLRHARLRLRRLGVHPRRHRANSRSPARDDDAHFARDHRRVRVQPGGDASAFPGFDLWWELATLVTIMVLGHWIEMRSISQAQGALQGTGETLPDTASGSSATARKTSRLASCETGDLVLVRPGASVPADGVVRDGPSDVNESMITGESRPVRKDVGEHGDRRNRQRIGLAARRGHGYG